jgi:hypothetical protein
VPHSGQKAWARLFPLFRGLDVDLGVPLFSTKVPGKLAMPARNTVPVSFWQSVQRQTLTVAGSTSAS